MQHFDDRFVGKYCLFLWDQVKYYMNFDEYLSYFEAVLTHPEEYPIYTDPEYFNYTKLNWSRTNRWLKRFELSDVLKEKVAAINEPQKWILITEPWCGDAAHSVPQIVKIARQNPRIELDIQLRDEEPFLIEQYLTNGGKSIPKLIARNTNGEDIFVWGPRPDALQQLFVGMKDGEKSFEEVKEIMQKWYNEDKGDELQKEFAVLL